jgi:probable rRNA maturation factor
MEVYVDCRAAEAAGFAPLIERVARACWGDKPGAWEAYEACEVSVSLVDDGEIRFLNKKYRGQDKVTDVLSFPLGEEAWGGALGDIVICCPQARTQAAALGHSPEREVAFLTAHGMLHLLGYDHQTEPEAETMFQLQEHILEGLGFGRKP